MMRKQASDLMDKVNRMLMIQNDLSALNAKAIAKAGLTMQKNRVDFYCATIMHLLPMRSVLLIRDARSHGAAHESALQTKKRRNKLE